MSLELLFLGTGTSAGVPMIGCRCDVCTSHDPRDHRDRASVLVQYPNPNANQKTDEPDTRTLLIDASPEMRLQMVRHDICRIDGVFITHTHADHIFGIDDLRRFNAVMDSPIDLYAEPDALDRLKQTYSYIFEKHRNTNASFVATLIGQILAPGETIDLFGAIWTPLRLMHGRLPIVGFRVNWQNQSLAYCTDVSSIPPETYPLLEGLDLLVIDALRYKHHPTHMTIDQALMVIDQVKPRRAYLTHLAHDVRHADLEAQLPEHVTPAFDGLTVSCESHGKHHHG